MKSYHHPDVLSTLSENSLRVFVGRPVAKLKTGPSKSHYTTIKERHEKNTENPILAKYSDLKVADLKNLLKPFSIRGLSGMRRDELLQTCLLYDSELTSELYYNLTTTSWSL